MAGGASCGLEFLSTRWNSSHAANVYISAMVSCLRNLTWVWVTATCWNPQVSKIDHWRQQQHQHCFQPLDKSHPRGEMNSDPQLLLSLQISPPPCWCCLLTSPSSRQRCKWDQDVLLRHSNWLFPLSSWAICSAKNAKIASSSKFASEKVVMESPHYLWPLIVSCVSFFVFFFLPV